MQKLDLKTTLERWFRTNRPDNAYTFDEVYAQFRRWKTRAFSCKRGEVCVLAGTPATDFVLVERGVLHVKVPSEIGDDLLLRAIRPNEYVGLTHVFADDPVHHYEVVAGADTVYFSFNVAEVRKWRTDPKSQPLFDYFGRRLCDICREGQTKAMILSGADISERLRRYLAVRMQKEGSRTIAIPGTAADLAHYLGVNNCALSRAVGRLRKEGKIKFANNVFTVLKINFK